MSVAAIGLIKSGIQRLHLFSSYSCPPLEKYTNNRKSCVCESTGLFSGYFPLIFRSDQLIACRSHRFCDLVKNSSANPASRSEGPNGSISRARLRCKLRLPESVISNIFLQTPRSDCALDAAEKWFDCSRWFRFRDGFGFALQFLNNDW